MTARTLYRPRLLLPLLAALVFGLAGCATRPPVPDVIRDAPPGDLRIAEVRTAEDAQRYVGTAARWGGTVIEVRNRAEGTDILVLGRPLDRDGRPQEGGTPQGRFILRSDRFLDPAVYARDREVTAYGKVLGVETRPVGDYDYPYPVLGHEHLRLWPVRLDPALRDRYYDPFYDPFYGPYYSPFYDPWYPWGPWRRPYRW